MTLIIALLLAVCLPHEPSLGKKPPKPPPVPPTPPVQYSIQLFGAPNGGRVYLFGMNDVGCVVGRYYISETNGYHGYVYNHPQLAPGLHDLNDIVSDLPDDDGDGVPDWHIRNANSVNLWGDIVGSIFPNDSPDVVHRACFIDMNAKDEENEPQPRLILIDPDYELGTYTTAHSINIYGEIAGHFPDDEGTFQTFLSHPGLYTAGLGPIDLGVSVYWPAINDHLELAGTFYDSGGHDQVNTPLKYQLFLDGTAPVGGVLEGIIPDSKSYIGGINNNGIVVGNASFRVGKGKKTEVVAYRYDTRFGTEPDPVFGGSGPQGINDNGDFINARGSIYLDIPLAAPHDPGYFFVDELIDPDDPNAYVLFGSGFRLFALNNRTEDGEFGQIAGAIGDGGSGELGFVLTPK